MQPNYSVYADGGLFVQWSSGGQGLRNVKHKSSAKLNLDCLDKSELKIGFDSLAQRLAVGVAAATVMMG